MSSDDHTEAATSPSDGEVFDAMAQLAYFHPEVHSVRLRIAGTHMNYLAVDAGDWTFNLHNDEDRARFVEWGRTVRNVDLAADPPRGSGRSEP